MTRKDYALLAKHMRHMNERVHSYPEVFDQDTFDQTVMELGNALMEENHRFNREHFENAIYGDKR